MGISGIKYGIDLYVTSDDVGIDIMIKLRSPAPFSEVKKDVPLIDVLKNFRKDGIGIPEIIDTAIPEIIDTAKDWRLMTEEEIADYEAGEEG